MKKYLLVWFKTLGSAYAAASALTLRGGRILELVPFGTKGHLFIEIGADVPTEDIKVSAENYCDLNPLPEAVMQAYLSLKNPALQEDLVVVEGAFLGDVFKAAVAAHEKGLVILDLRFIRDAGAHSYALFSGSSQSCESFVKMLPKELPVQSVKSPSDGLREFFPRR